MSESKPLPAEAMLLLQRAATRSKRTVVSLPTHFIRAREHGTVPPLAHLFGLGESRLRLYLTLKMIATKPPYEMKALRPQEVAIMLNFNDPSGSGIRTAQEALTALVKAKFVDRVPHPGLLADLTIQTPGQARTPAERSRWTNLPIELWTNGWIITLSARALTVYIALREVTGGREDVGTWIDGTKRKLYGLGAEVWRLGTKELEAYGLIVSDMKTKPDGWNQKRRRKHYYLNVLGTQSLPASPSVS